MQDINYLLDKFKQNGYISYENINYIFKELTPFEISTIFVTDYLDKIHNQKFIDAFLKTLIKKLNLDEKKQLLSMIKFKSILQNTVILIEKELELVNKKYDYLWKIITEIKDLSFAVKLVNKDKSYLKLTDDNGNSLLINIMKMYLKEPDVYYLQVLSFILESTNLINSSDLLLINELVLSVEDESILKNLNNILRHYLSISREVLNRENEIKKAPIITNNRPLLITKSDYVDRKDLTELNTFTIDNSSLAKRFNADEAYSIIKTESGYIVYYHLADTPEFIDEFGQLDLRASRLIKNEYNDGLQTSIYDKNFISDYVSLRAGLNHLAVTFMYTLNENFDLLDTQIFESIIAVNDNYCVKEADKLLKSNTDLYMLYNFCNKLNLSNSLGVKSIQECMSTLTNLESAKIALEQKIPFIYKNLTPEKSLHELLVLTEEFWSDEQLQKFMKTIKRERFNEPFYYNSFIDNIMFNAPYTSITNPERMYISLETLRMIKKALLRGLDKKQTIYWQERLLKDSITANAVNYKK